MSSRILHPSSTLEDGIQTKPIPVFKVVVAGDGNVGKTSLVRRFCEGKFEQSRLTTIGVDFQTKIVPLQGGSVKLSIWDMAGQKRFKEVRAGFYRGSRATVLVYDLTIAESLVNLYHWYLEIKRILPNQRFIVVGNKSDLSDVSYEWAGVRLAKTINAAYQRTSALTGEGVDHLFHMLAVVASNS